VSAIDALVESLPRTTLVVGKGGVGKTTCASALALCAARRTETLLLSTDPARALPSVLGQDPGEEGQRLAGAQRLEARQLEASALRDRFMSRWGGVLRAILDRGTYLDGSDIDPLVDTAMPGSDEIFSALALAELLVDPKAPYGRIVVDTAPTGHTLRLLSLPRTFRALVQLLEAMQEKHRFMVRTLTRTYRRDDADAFLAEMRGLVDALDATLRDSNRCAAVLVTNTQELVVDESRRYVDELERLSIRVAAIVWNASTANTRAIRPDGPHFVVPRLRGWPVGIDGLRAWGAALRRADGSTSKAPSVSEARPSAGRAGKRSTTQAHIGGVLRPLTIVAGKGGVGKTTVAAALALRSAADAKTLLVSTDPAPSIADALAHPFGDADTPIPGVPGLFARQMDASAAFDRLRLEYQQRVDALFDGILARGVDITHDRAVTRDLLALAPPGIDEVYALSLIADALFKNDYARVIVDPAPTGHLLRLLEMPQLALAWTHQLMRLMLKYKEVAALGETAQELLEFSRSLRALDALLHDPERAALVVVWLDEPVVRAETERLLAEAYRLDVRVGATVLNRADDPMSTLPVAAGVPQFEAPEVTPAPIGVKAIEGWARRWRALDTAPKHGARTSRTRRR